jgi:hypothetical protein
MGLLNENIIAENGLAVHGNHAVIKEHGRRECPFLELTELTAGFRKRSKIVKLGRFIVFSPLK